MSPLKTESSRYVPQAAFLRRTKANVSFVLSTAAKHDVTVAATLGGGVGMLVRWYLCSSDVTRGRQGDNCPL